MKPLAIDSKKVHEYSLEILSQTGFVIKDAVIHDQLRERGVECDRKTGVIRFLPEQVFEWNQSKLFIKQLQNASFRLVFEVAGNNGGIVMSFLLHRADMSIVISAFQGQFESRELASVNETPWPEMPERQWGNVRFKERRVAFSHYLGFRTLLNYCNCFRNIQKDR